MPIVFSDHAKEKLKYRGLTQETVLKIIQDPEKILPSFRWRKLRQKRIDGKLLEAVTKTERSKIIVITVYILEG